MKKKKQEDCRGARKLKTDEGMAWAPPRNKSDWLDWEEARIAEKNAWSQREKRMCQKSLSCRMRSKALTWTLMAPKRKVIRVESEETQDYVREAKSAEQEEVDFCPKCGQRSAEKLLFRFDNPCNVKALSFWQLASVVINEGEESYNDQLMPDVHQQFSEGKRRKNH